VLPALLAATISSSQATERDTAAIISGTGSNVASFPSGLSKTGDISAPVAISLQVPATKWTRKMQKRFDELARLEAVGKLIPDQVAELEYLSRTRQRLLFPRTADDIIFEMKERQLNSRLRVALRDYVAFHNATENQKRKASR
jgi:hypothetical protein